jgi:hypothetical protein
VIWAYYLKFIWNFVSAYFLCIKDIDILCVCWNMKIPNSKGFIS